MKTPTLPTGFCAVPMTADLEQAAVDVINAAYRLEYGGGDFTTLQEMQAGWQAEGFNKAADILLAAAPDGKIVGYVEHFGLNALHVRHGAFIKVHPDWMGLGVGTYLLHWAIDHVRENITKAPEDARVVLHQFVNLDNRPACTLLEANGFHIVRRSYRMGIEFDQPPAPPDVPPGIEIRPIHTGEERAMLEANYEAFRDHWGAVDEPFEEYFKHFMHDLEHDENADPSLWFIALDGDAVAGVAINNPKTNEDPEMGWVWQLSVRKPWRGRGLGLALLQNSFYAIYQHGSKRAALGVDAESITGANRLYERAGMRVLRKNCTYEYELRPGRDLMKK